MNDTNTPESAISTKAKLDLVFLGADGFPIEGLKGRVVVDTEERPFETNALGTTDALHVAPDATVQIHVMRMDGTYKEIQRCEAGHADACWSFISPSIVFEATTELHQGEPGTIAQDIPQWVIGDDGERDKGKETMAGAAPFEEGFEPTQVVLGDVPLTTPMPRPARPAKATAPQAKVAPMPDPSRVQATQTIKSAVTTGRDANGNPMVVFTKKVRDWWGSWHFPTWDMSWGAQAATVSRNQIAAPVAGSTLSKAQLEAAQKQIKRLIEFAKKQATYDYPDSSTSASIIASLKNGSFVEPPPPAKPVGVGLGHCYKHVKVALAYAGIVDGVVGDGAPLAEQKAASMAGPSLVAKGFREVTADVPDARWAAAGDVITYEWSAKTWTERKKKYGQNCLNYGHIDIRDYETYISDFVASAPAYRPRWINNPNTPKAYLEYVNIKIFRKVFDPMPTLHIKAFLRCLQWCEVFGAEPSKWYRVQRGFNPFTYFDSFKVHPAHNMAAGFSRDNTPAGAYQIIYKTWRVKMESNVLQLPAGADMFSPDVQDRIAVVLIEDMNALHLVRTAQLDAAVSALRGTWTSLPGANQNVAGRTMDTFKSNFAQYLAEEKRKVGLV